MTKPWIIAASSGSITVLMPTSCAMTPPRSMSPISTTGTSALRAKPILAMSALRRLTSAGLPAPSTSTRSARSFSRAKLSSTAPISDGFRAAYSRARAVATRLPCTMTCAPTSVSGFKQDRVHVGVRFDAGGQRLQGLRTADLAAIDRHGRVVRHVLRLEGQHAQAASPRSARKASDDERLAHVRAGSLDHQCARHRIVLLRIRRPAAP